MCRFRLILPILFLLMAGCPAAEADAIRAPLRRITCADGAPVTVPNGDAVTVTCRDGSRPYWGHPTCDEGFRLSGKDQDEKRCVPDKPKPAKKRKGWIIATPPSEPTADCCGDCICNPPPSVVVPCAPCDICDCQDCERELDHCRSDQRMMTDLLNDKERPRGHLFTLARLGFASAWSADVATRETERRKLDHAASVDQARSPQLGLIAGWVFASGWTLGGELDWTRARIRTRSWDDDGVEIARTRVSVDRGSAWSLGIVAGKVWK